MMNRKLTISACQEEIKNMLSILATVSLRSLPKDIQHLTAAVSQSVDPNLLNHPDIEDELVKTFLRALSLCTQLGIDIESKIRSLFLEFYRRSFIAG